MKKTLQSVSVVLAMLFVFSACELTTSPEDLQDAGETVGENVNAELTVIDVFEDVNNYGFNKDGLKRASLLGEGPSFSWSGNTMILDFTDVPNASGTITVEFSGTPGYTQGLLATLTFADYEKNGTALDGKMKLTINEVSNESALFTMETIDNLSITEGGITYLWSINQTIRWAEGIATISDNSDDSFLLNGSAIQTMDTLVNTMSLSEIVYASDCEYIKDGILVLVKDSESENSIEISTDFGIDQEGNDSGECDGWVRLTSGGLTLKIDLDTY